MIRLALLLAATAALAQGDGWLPRQTAELQALDKVNARTATLTAPVGGRVRYGTLEIGVRACHARAEGRAADSVAWLDISDTRGTARQVFAGWMFASAPAVNMLEHPVFDIRVVACR